jgi:putative transposase
VVAVSAAGSARVSLAGLVCTKPGQRSRLIYRTRTHRGRKGEPKGFAEGDYAALLDAAHQQLGGSIVLVWDGLNTHVSRLMKRLVATRPWLRVVQLPAYAPELNPVEAVWSHLTKSLTNLTKHSIDQLLGLIKTRLPGSGSALLRRRPLRTVHATRRGTRPKQATWAARSLAATRCSLPPHGCVCPCGGRWRVRGVFDRRVGCWVRCGGPGSPP